MEKTMTTLLIITAAAFAFIPWPILPTGDTHTLYHSYGDYHKDWLQINPDGINFHFGIDLAIPSGGNDDVLVVENGSITDMPEGLPPTAEHYFVICHADTTDQGWMYGHLNNEKEWINGNNVSKDELLASIHPDPLNSFPHLHFMRSLAVYDDEEPGLRNPLQSLDPTPIGTSFWDFLSVLPCRFVENHDIAYWEANWIDPVNIDSIPRGNLEGAIDILYGMSLWTTGQTGPQQYFHWVSPRRLFWKLMRWDSSISQWVIVEESPGDPFERYVFDFDGELGAASDYEKYKQIYFLHDVVEWLGAKYAEGDFICLTNCSDATGWDGINNIEENCWNTVLASDGSGDSYNPLNQVTPDGPYQVDITAYAWDTSVEQSVTTDVYVKNTRPIAWEVIITDQATDQEMWHAKWIASEGTDSFEPEKLILSDVPVSPGTDLDVEIIFSEPMDKNVALLSYYFPISV